MIETQHRHRPAPVQRLSVVADPELLDALHAHQRKVEHETGLRLSLSQIAGSLMRRSLEHNKASQ